MSGPKHVCVCGKHWRDHGEGGTGCPKYEQEGRIPLPYVHMHDEDGDCWCEADDPQAAYEAQCLAERKEAYESGIVSIKEAYANGIVWGLHHAKYHEDLSKLDIIPFCERALEIASKQSECVGGAEIGKKKG